MTKVDACPARGYGCLAGTSTSMPSPVFKPLTIVHSVELKVLFSMHVLSYREMMELLNNPVAQDVTPISGTVTFAPGVTSSDLEVNSVQDVEEEGNEVFTLSLMSVRGGAALSDGGDVALLSGEQLTTVILYMILFWQTCTSINQV